MRRAYKYDKIHKENKHASLKSISVNKIWQFDYIRQQSIVAQQIPS